MKTRPHKNLLKSLNKKLNSHTENYKIKECKRERGSY